MKIRSQSCATHVFILCGAHAHDTPEGIQLSFTHIMKMRTTDLGRFPGATR
jgi:hypothetical protein